MTTLTEQIEALRRRLIATHADETGMVGELSARLEAADAELLDQLRGMIDGHAQRRGDIVEALCTLAARIGHVPGGPRLPSGQPAADRMLESADAHSPAQPYVFSPAARLADLLTESARGVH